MLQTLARLALEPTSWSIGVENDDAQSDKATEHIAEEGIPKYLTSIVASPLQWIEETSREAIWEAASARLSERSGRAGELKIPLSVVNPLWLLPGKNELYEGQRLAALYSFLFVHNEKGI